MLGNVKTKFWAFVELLLFYCYHYSNESFSLLSWLYGHTFHLQLDLMPPWDRNWVLLPVVSPTDTDYSSISAAFLLSHFFNTDIWQFPKIHSFHLNRIQLWHCSLKFYQISTCRNTDLQLINESLRKYDSFFGHRAHWDLLQGVTLTDFLS